MIDLYHNIIYSVLNSSCSRQKNSLRTEVGFQNSRQFTGIQSCYIPGLALTFKDGFRFLNNPPFQDEHSSSSRNYFQTQV